MKAKRKFNTDIPYPDILELFFQDVGNIASIPGRQEYIPLTRRIERGRILRNIPINEVGMNRLIMKITNQRWDFLNACQSEGISVHDDDLVQLGEVESFLDDYFTKIPPQLDKILANTNNQICWQKGWRLSYGLSLLTANARINISEFSANSHNLERLDLIRSQYIEARNKLIEGTLRYTIRYAIHLMDDSVNYLDLVQVGFTGIYRAIDLFEEYKGTHFQSYAVVWIFQAMSRYKADYSRLIRIPVHVVDRVAQLQKLYDSIGSTPTQDELLHLWGQESQVENLQQATKDVNNFLIATAKHYPIDATFRSKFGTSQFSFAEELVANDDTETQVLDAIVTEDIYRIFDDLIEKGILPKRECDILFFRFGLEDGLEHTLEEVGQKYGITRERIRQLETQALERLKRVSYRFEGMLSLKHSRLVLSLKHSRLESESTSSEIYLQHLVTQLPYTLPSIEANPTKERIKLLVDQYIMKGNKRLFGGGRFKSSHRKTYIVQILEEASIPLHFRDIHERALAVMPPSMHCSPDRTYSLLFYGQDFHKLGNGVFALSSWNMAHTVNQSDHVLQYCPEPLRSENNQATFFDSILVGRQYLTDRPYRAQEFYRRMCEWAQQPFSISNFTSSSGAFAAWYAVGLLDYIDLTGNQNPELRLTLPSDLKLAQVREKCLNNLVRRIQKMPELLAIISKLGHPTLNDLQTVLFGDPHHGYDVPIRLELLRAFEAIQPNGKSWQLTPIGEKLLQQNLPDVLPDLSAIMEDYAEANVQESDTELLWDDFDDFDL